MKNSHGKLLKRIRDLEKELEKEKQRYAELLEKYENARICKLTKLPGRERLEEEHGILLALNKRGASKAISLVVIDVDHFKSVNDTHGHDVGDSVLMSVAKALSSSKRPNDVLVRWGGEEFATLLADVHSLQSASAFVNRLRSVVKEDCRLPNGKSVTISAGVFIDKSGEMELPELFKRADKNMYLAKKHGRDRVVVSSS